MKYPIIATPDPVLRKTSRALDFKNDKPLIRQLTKEMVKAMADYDGIGLSAPQLGQNVRLITAKFDNSDFDSDEPSFDLHVMINPKIIRASKETISYLEGCLSLPNIEIEIERPYQILVEYIDTNGKKTIKSAEKLLSRVIQHEIDHLNGILFTDYLPKKAFSAQFEALSALKVAFIASDQIAVPLLNKLADSALRPTLVITESAKPSGRGLKIQPNAIAEAAHAHDLALRETSNKQETEELFKKYQFDIALIFAFGQIVTQETIDQCKWGIYNVHPSLLPKYRGATPIQSALLANDSEAGVCLIKINNEMDAGDITFIKKFPIEPNDHSLDLWQKVAKISADSIPKALAETILGKATLHKQSGELTLCHKLDPALRQLTADLSVKEMLCRIRAFNNAKCAYIFTGGKRFNIRRATLTKEGKLRLIDVRIENKKGTDPKSFDAATRNSLQNFHKMLEL